MRIAEPDGSPRRCPMDLNASAQKEITHRLRRARGQIEGVITMLEAGRPCRDIVTQLAAAARALDKAGYKLIATSMQECLLADGTDSDVTPEELEKLFISLA
jgi:DNA-binding FrmR family transcriptional regulator